MNDRNKFNGILNVLKPPGMTSFDVVGHLKKVLAEKKIGHTGTLDPGAAGVLPVCVGSATRAVGYLTEKDKLYRAELTLGIATDTQDSFGNVLYRKEPDVTEEQIMEVMKGFMGRQLQIPPMYSAIKVEGKRLYELARSGITIERKPREIEIFKIDIIEINGDKILFDVLCSKGTYIRTLCSDIGEKLLCGGHMSFLLRLRSGEYDLLSSLTLEEISDSFRDGSLKDKILKTDTAFSSFDSISLEADDEKRLCNGVAVKLGAEVTISERNGLVKVYNNFGSFIALGSLIEKQGQKYIKAEKFFN
jgi:tRNA pseudouridine55 synthase